MDSSSDSSPVSSTDKSTEESTDASTDKSSDKSTNGKTVASTDKSTEGSKDEIMVKSSDEGTKGSPNKSTDSTVSTTDSFLDSVTTQKTIERAAVSHNNSDGWNTFLHWMFSILIALAILAAALYCIRRRRGSYSVKDQCDITVIEYNNRK